MKYNSEVHNLASGVEHECHTKQLTVFIQFCQQGMWCKKTGKRSLTAAKQQLRLERAKLYAKNLP
jgi:hypothetical protein